MLRLVLESLSTLSAMLIYFDATANKIGKIKGEKSFLNMSAGGWAFCCWGTSVVAIPAYLLTRKKLLQKATLYPVEVSRAGIFKTTALLLLLDCASLALTTHGSEALRTQSSLH